jgi:hypothetical protein
VDNWPGRVACGGVEGGRLRTNGRHEQRIQVVGFSSDAYRSASRPQWSAQANCAEKTVVPGCAFRGSGRKLSSSPCILYLARKSILVMQGPLAQLVERHVYTVDVIGSSPVGPTGDPCGESISPTR